MNYRESSTRPISDAGSAPLTPLTGHTILLVEDSRFASEALRLMCHYSGGRMRRADTLRAAYRHLAVYRPDAVIIDLGLPDGSGLDLIADLARSHYRPARVIATSGMTELQGQALRTGADAFLPKPVASLAAFHSAFAENAPPASASEPAFTLRPDRLALRDDLHMAADLLTGRQTPESLSYTTQFIDSIAASLQDDDLRRASIATRKTGEIGQLPVMLRHRLRAEAII